MFTGLVEEMGTVKNIVTGTSSIQLTVTAKKVLEDVKIGDSIAINGTCLTVIEFGKQWFTADVMPETIKRTVLNYLKPGHKVNCERTLRVGDRMGGHIVTGHIDGIGRITSKEMNDIAVIIKISSKPEVLHYIVEKGSIAIDGISLTVVTINAQEFSVSLIPHSAKETTLGIKGVGDFVNLETDIIGKYVEKLIGKTESYSSKSQPKPTSLSSDFLSQHGFL